MKHRLYEIKKIIKKKNLDAVLISSIPNITYFTNLSNFSKEEREAYLLFMAQPQGLTDKTPGVNGYIITDGRYSEAVVNHISNTKLDLLNYELIEISASSSLKKILTDFGKKIKKIGIEEENLSVKEHTLISSCFKNLIDFDISALRAVKKPEEIATIENACKLGDKTFEYILKKVKPEITEKELAFEIEFFIKKQGADISFYPIVAFDKNSSIPHHQTGNHKLKTNSFVLFDFGVKIDNYCSDMTRTIILGKANDKQKKIYQTVLDTQAKAIDYVNNITIQQYNNSNKESIKASEVDKIARLHINEQGSPAIPHSLGHGIGLQVHESPSLSPRSKDVLKEGMVFSIEPGIYIPGFGGVRIEDLVVLEEKGLRILTKSPKKLIELF